MKGSKVEIVQVLDKKFTPYINQEEIAELVTRVAKEVSRDLRNEKPIFLPVLNGSFMFASDLMKQLGFPAELSFIKFSSYQNTETTGTVKELIGFERSMKGRTVVVIEDIVDTGYTMQTLIQTLKEKEAKQVKVVTLFSKPEARKVEVPIDYLGMEIGNNFIVGYGLDYNGEGRNLPCIYELVKD